MNAMTMRIQRGADGTMRHVPAPITAAPPKRGRKNPVVPDPIKTNGDSAAEELRLLIERIERIREEKRAIADDERDVFGEAKARGYDAKGLRAILTLRQKEKHVLDEEEAIIETYRSALGML